ncbi:MAG: hypothetical protein EBY65_09600, partial [Acidimicrobiia bacterium]|nr:hypothetical protein [Acidimicrobiia bacterium]
MPSFSNPFRRTASDDTPDLVDDEEGLVDDADSEWLAYELHEWASETRAMLAQLLIADQVPHSWQGTTLLAHESVEETVDALMTYSPDETRAKTSSAFGPPEPGTKPPSANCRVGKTLPKKFTPVVITAFAARSAKPFLMALVNVEKSTLPVIKKS